MHVLLRRQLRDLGLDPDAIPQPMRTLLERVSRTYEQAEQERNSTGQALASSAREMQALQAWAAAEVAAKERQRRSSAAILETMHEASADGMLVTYADGGAPAANRRFRELWGLSADAPIADARQLAVHMAEQSADAPALLDLLEVARARPGDPVQAEVVLRDGRVIACRSLPVRAAEGEPAARVWLFHDLAPDRGTADAPAARERAQRTVDARTAVADRLTALGRLAAGVAQEIDNPLSYANGNLAFVTEELQRSEGPSVELEDLLEAIRRAREGTDRIHRVTRDLRLFADGESDRRTGVDLRRVIESAANLAFHEIRHRARLVKDYGDTPIVQANEGRLGQVFLNLLLNAAQSIPEGTPDRHKIKIVTRTEESDAVVEVLDTGEGIAPEHLPHLFEPFFTTKPAGRGTGLGLAMCHGIVSALGGVIEVESTPGAGSLFRVRIPANVLSTSDALEPVSAERAGRAGRVLVIDDEPLVLSTVRRALAREHDVVTLQDAREALALFQRGERFDLILCDLMMPTMTGMELHAAVRAQCPDVLPRLVFVTAGAFTARAREFLDETGAPCLDKPFDLPELRAVARRYVGQEGPRPGETPRQRTPNPVI